MQAVDGRIPVPVHTSNSGATSSAGPASSTATGRSQNQTVVVQNPMSLDESGKLMCTKGLTICGNIAKVIEHLGSSNVDFLESVNVAKLDSVV
ncbi:hypothetical protein H5410_005679 [Solanum commersonii]|uniref:Uncharacterized protein n=1 Tax=Solanum commersonii TaxID=4109 RepID=A0A9J6A793_SOLCO|nr:hypothetical protein H5410_005679 [Solanum commersonii]